MGKTIKIDNIQGGKAPYEVELIPLGVQSATSFNDVPNGVFRAKVVDDDDKTTLPKVVLVADPTYNTDRRINWDKIPPFSLPEGLTAIWGAGSPRWLDEASPTDAMVHGWTHTNNANIDGAELVDAKREKAIYFPYGGASALLSAINQVKATHPTVVNAAIIQEFRIVNQTNSDLNFSYTDYQNQTVNATVSAPQGQPEEEMTVACLFDTQPQGTGSYYQGIIRIYNPDAVTDAGYVALGRAYYNQEKWSPDGITGNPALRKAGVIFYNEETLGNSGRANQLLFKGMSLEATAQNSPLKIIFYGKEFVGWGGGFYSGQQNDNVSWKKKVFPNLSPTIRTTAEQLTEYANRTELGEANCVVLNSGTYFKVPYPSGVKYEKQNDNYVLDQDGERKWRLGQFSEQIRGQSVTFLADTLNGGWIGSGPSYGYPNNRVPEIFWAVWQMYSAISYTIYVNIALAKKYRGNSDIYNSLADLPVKAGVIMRHDTEATAPAYSDKFRPLTAYQVEWSVLSSFALTEFYEVWTDILPIRHPNENASPVATNKGSGYGSQFLDFSQFEEMTWALKHIAYISPSGVFSNGNKKIVAYEPANTTNEIMIFGRIKSNKIWVFASEPRLDPNEFIVVTLTNKKNNYSQKFAVKHNENFSDVFTLPSTDSYEPSDIVFTYKDIYNVEHKVSGDLRQHLVTGNPIITPPVTGSSIFEFFPKSNGQGFPTGNQGNNYILFQFASWSIVSSDPNTTPTTVQSFVRCKLYDDANNLVCNILDTRGNYHPSFAPFFPSGTDLRSNNHLAPYLKYLPFGAYRIEIENISVSDVTMKLRLGWAGIGGTAMELLNDEPLVKGGTKTLNFNVGNTWTDGNGTVHNYTDGSNMMILNFNVYQYP